ncbi:MAG: hypothetical protein PHX38_02810 [Sulfuricella sp.]|nr:hypothetical protein [Sulfuricella sp.]
MKNWMRLMSWAAGGFMLLSGIALAEDKPAGCSKAGTPENVEGQVMKVDPAQGKLTMRTGDGTVHEFQAAKETLQNYKVGDTIKAKLRCEK